MTDEHEGLIRDLRWMGGGEAVPSFPPCLEAADLIEHLLAQNRRLRTSADEDYIARREDMRKRIIELEAQNRRLQEELEKAKADLGARNRILTEEP